MKVLFRLATFAVVAALMVISPAFPALAQGDGNPLCNGLEAADCEVLTNSAANLEGLTSFRAPSYAISFDADIEGDQMAFSAAGNAAFMLPADPMNPTEGLMVYLQIDNAMANDGTQSQEGSATVLVKDGMAYVNYNDQWYGDSLDEADLEGLDISQLSSASEIGLGDIDLTNVLLTARGDDAELMGQSMMTYVTNVDIVQLITVVLGSPAVGQALAGQDMGMEGMTPEDLQMIGMMLAPLLQGTSITLEQWIGADDGLVHKVALNADITFDMSMFDPEAAPMALNLSFEAEIADYNGTFEYEAPAEYAPMDELNAQLEGAQLGLDNLGM